MLLSIRERVGISFIIGGLLFFFAFIPSASASSLLNSTACTNGTTKADYTCTIPATTAGSLLVILQNDTDNPGVPPVPTNVAGSTCVRDFTEANSQAGRRTVFSCANVAAGTTAVSIHRVSGNSAVNIREYAGMATIAPFDTAVSASIGSQANITVLGSQVLNTSHTDTVIGFCSYGYSANTHFATADVWGNGKDWPQVNGTTDNYAVDILNAPIGPYTAAMTADPKTGIYWCGAIAYKSAIVGTTPTGNIVEIFSDFENFTPGTVLTTALLRTGIHGGYLPGLSVGNGFTISNAAQMPMGASVTANGTTYTTNGTRGVSYAYATNPGQGIVYVPPFTTPALNMLMYFSVTSNSTLHGIAGIEGSGDFALAQTQMNPAAPSILLECRSGDTSTLPMALNTPYAVVLEYRAGGTHTMKLYGGANYSTLVGTRTCPANGTNNAKLIEFGENHQGGAGAPGNLFVDNVVVSEGTVGLVPITTYTIGGTLSGLSGTVILQNNGADNITRSVNGAFTFASGLVNNAGYAVTILTQPVGQTCAVTNGSGTVSSANVNNISISCTDNPAVPTLLAPTFSNITTVDATAASSITTTSGNDATVEGFAWGTDTSYSLGTTSLNGSFGISSFQDVISPLVCDTTYHVRAYATNSVGTGYSNDANFTTSPCPATTYTVTGPSSGNVGSASSNFSVTPDGLYTGTITLTPSGGGGNSLSPIVLTFSNSSAVQTFTITPTVSGPITLTATNDGGLTDPADLLYNVQTAVPGVPTSVLAATSSPNQATVSFTPPAFDGDSPILSYIVSSTPGNITATGTDSPLVVSGLTNGTSYTFTVSAINAVGTSLPSAASNSIIPIGVPSAPGTVVATAGDTQASVTFSAPASNGGSPITGYTVISNPAGGVDTNAGSTALAHVITGLINGNDYTFSVTATNSVGTSDPSNPSNLITPVPTPPQAPPSASSLLNSTACTNGTTKADYTCIIPSTTAGSLLVILQNDADNPGIPPVPTNVVGSTCVRDWSEANSQVGRRTVFSCANVAAGTTAVSIHRLSGNSSVNIREYAGMATVAPFDTVTSSSIGAQPNATVLGSRTLNTSQADVVIGFCSYGYSANTHFAAADVWGNGKDWPQTNISTDNYAVDILNATPGPYTLALTADPKTGTYWCGAIAYKSAVIGNTPAGNIVEQFLDFENGTPGTALTTAILRAGSHGGYVPGLSVGNGFTISNAAQMPAETPVIANGTTYAGSGTRGISYAYATNPMQSIVYVLSQAVPDLNMLIHFSVTSNSTLHNIAGIQAAGNDYAIVQTQMGATPSIILQCRSGDTSTLPMALNTPYAVVLEYRAGGTHTMKLYGGANYSTLLGTKTCSATGTYNVTFTSVGESRQAGAGAPGNLFIDNLMVSRGTTSLMP